MNQLELAWDTFYFHTEQICYQESEYINVTQTLHNLLLSNHQRHQRKRMKVKLHNCMDSLIVSYKKHIYAISDLINLNNDLVDIPEEYEIDVSHLASLKSLTIKLIEETILSKEEINNLLS